MISLILMLLKIKQWHFKIISCYSNKNKDKRFQDYISLNHINCYIAMFLYGGFNVWFCFILLVVTKQFCSRYRYHQTKNVTGIHFLDSCTDRWQKYENKKLFIKRVARLIYICIITFKWHLKLFYAKIQRDCTLTSIVTGLHI